MPKTTAKPVDPTKVHPSRRTEDDVMRLPPGDHSLGGGLMVRVESRGNQSRKYFSKPTCIDRTGEKKRRPFSIGTPGVISLEAAHFLNIQIHQWADAGRDVRQELDNLEGKKAAIPTFGQHAEAFMDRHLATLKNAGHAEGWRASIYNHVKTNPIWHIKIDEISIPDVLAVLDPIWKTIPVMASSVRSRIEMIIGDAANRYSIERIQTFNPAKWTKSMGHSLGGKPPKSGETRGAQKAVPYKEVPAMMVELRQRACQSARAIYAITLSALRWQEFVKMEIDELDLDAEQPTWTIPFERFKYDTLHKQPYVLPLSPQLVAVLREQIAELEAIYGKGNFRYIWPGQAQGRKGGDAADTHISSGTMLSYLQKSMGYAATVHGMRASFDTWSDDQFLEGTNSTPKYHWQALDFCLAHIAPGGKTKKSYRRGMMFDARIGIMNDWADFCVPRETASATSDDNVVKFPKSA